MGIVQHDKDDGDINGAIGVTATFVYARSPRSGPLSTTQSVAVQSHWPPDIAGLWLRAVCGAL
jgi:hypothetical protein